MKAKRHVVHVMQPPTEAHDSRGQTQGQDTIYLKNVPCSIEPLSSQEQIVAHQVYADATHRVEMYGDPKKPITTSHWLNRLGRRLEIGSAIDVHQNGTYWRLLVSEAVL